MSLALPDYNRERALRALLSGGPRPLNDAGRVAPASGGEEMPGYTPPAPPSIVRPAMSAEITEPDLPTYTPQYGARARRATAPEYPGYTPPGSRRRAGLDPATGAIWERPPGEDNPYDSVEEQLRAEMNAEVVDGNGRVMSGVNAALGRRVTPTDSIGNALGQLGGAFLGGVLKPKSDEEAAHQKRIGELERLAKIEREQKEHEATVRLREAQAASQENLPGYRQGQLDNAAQRNRIAEIKAAHEREYKDNLLTMKSKDAEEIRKHRAEIIRLRERGLDQGDERIKQAQARIDEIRENNRLNREQRAAQHKEREARLGGTGGGKADVRGASSAIQRFNSLTTRIAAAREMGDDEKADALIDERDSLEDQIRTRFGEVVEDDDKGKPTRLKNDPLGIRR